MRVYVKPLGLFSPAMIRIAGALKRYKPAHVEIVDSLAAADLCVLYVISEDAIPFCVELVKAGKRYAIIQCCLETSGLPSATEWIPTWRAADVVWSYYDLRALAHSHGFKFHHAPLGVDVKFYSATDVLINRPNGFVMTSGHVSGPGCEAITPVWSAALRVGRRVIHTGAPSVVGDDIPHPNVSFVGKVSDETLASYYRLASCVVALRHVEGFELPAAEALTCGTRPLVFDQPTTRYWYGDLADYVEDTPNYIQLEDQIAHVFSRMTPLSLKEQTLARAIFNWQIHAEKFWSMVLGSQR